MKEMIKDIPFLLESLRDYVDITLLMFVAWIPDVDVFRFLLSFDQDLNIVDKHGWNIAHYIVRGYNDNDIVSVKMLDMLNTKTTNRLFKRMINHLDKYGRSPLYEAARQNHHETIIYLIENEVNINIRDNEDLPEEHEECKEETKQIFRRYRKQW